jgi:hypothetical protein
MSPQKFYLLNGMVDLIGLKFDLYPHGY